MEGGNIGVAQGDAPSGFAELDLLSTYHLPTERPVDLMWGTSAAAALAARLGARIQASYPTLWPETVRGLIVHSADWTPAMHERHQPLQSRQHARTLRSATVKLLPGERQKESRDEKPPPSAPDPNSTTKRQQADNNGVEAQEDFLLAGLHALANAFGAVGMVRFIQRISPGRGNYSIERDIILGNPTVDNLVDELERRRRDP